MSDGTGQQLGNYKLLRLLGEGGFAQVYLGEHIHLGTEAAIKVLHTQLTSDDVDQFRSEARTIARLKHRHIVRVLDFGVEGKTPFLVMDYAPNGTLRQHYPRGSSLPLSELVSYIKQVAIALQYAHDQKLIYRDIKPENMLLETNNEVLLSDFGIALVAQSSRYQSTQDVIGTVAYMSPEQIQGKPRPASDQYSLAIVAYEWLTGSRPFHGSFTEMCTQHMFASPPSLREKIPYISPDVERVIMTALSKDPHNRFTNVQAFANALEQASQPDIPTFVKPIVPWVGDTKPLENSTGTPLLPPTELAVPIVQSNVSPYLPPTQLVIPSHPIGTILYTYRGHSNRVNAVSWSHDSKRVVTGGDDNTAQVWDTHTKQSVFTYSGHSNAVNTVNWSSIGGRIASGSNDKTVHVWSAVTGGRTIIYNNHLDGIKSLAWSSDGRSIVSGSNGGDVHIWDADNGKYIVIYRGHSYPINVVAWSPDEELIASGGNSNEVQVWKATAGRKILSYQKHSHWIKAIVWSPDGTCIASAGDDKTIQIWNALTGTSLYTYRGHSRGIYAIAWSPDGKYIASSDEQGIVQIWKVVNGECVYNYRGHSDDVLAVAWSPDGKFIASASSDGFVHIWLVG